MLSLKFNNVYINDYDAIVGPNEIKGNTKNIKNVISDFYYDEKTFELAQIKMERNVIYNILKNNNLTNNNVDLIIGGDLSNQIACTSYSLDTFDISFLGMYGACSTFIESIIVASSLISNSNIKKAICLTANHNLVAERQFRYPVEYGALKNENSTFTSTASVACLLSSKKGNIRVSKGTIGTVKKLGINDPNYVGAVMAPSCAETIYNHFINFNIKPNYYDLVLTGDLGSVGVSILKDYLKEEYNLVLKNIIDAGSKLYKTIEDINDGASGPATLPLYLFYNVLQNKKYKKILVVGTGALHSKTLVNQKEEIPSISHAIELEVLS